MALPWNKYPNVMPAMVQRKTCFLPNLSYFSSQRHRHEQTLLCKVQALLLYRESGSNESCNHSSCRIQRVDRPNGGFGASLVLRELGEHRQQLQSQEITLFNFLNTHKQ